MTSPARSALTRSRRWLVASARRAHGHRPPGERPGLVPDSAWKLAERGALAVGRDARGRHRPGLPAGHAATARGHDRADRQWQPSGSTVAGTAAGRRRWQRPVPAAGASEALRFVKEGMHKVVNGERGTARSARLPNPEITMAGKTGTSQVRRISRTERLTGVRKNEEKSWEERITGCSSPSHPTARRAMPSPWWSSTAAAGASRRRRSRATSWPRRSSSTRRAPSRRSASIGALPRTVGRPEP